MTHGSNPPARTPENIDLSRDAGVRARTELTELRLHQAGVPDRYLSAAFKDCLAPAYLNDFFSTWSRDPRGFAFVYGLTGRGKTYLAACVLKRFFGYHPRLDFEAPGRYLAFDLPSRIRASIKTDSVEQFVSGIFKTPGLLVLDDLGVEDMTDWTREQVCRIIYHRYDASLPTLITSNRDLAWIAQNMDARVADRIAESDQVFEYIGPNRRLKQGG